ncbi:MAG: CDP-alcohol phosphatidyltransferase family protein [Nanoarchaeota archaeon]|nr:CDP-alcohol phosphatidyltransferase family protein [Nanoarchaeota archaeon]MBU1622178.1 CDP-alcohol phosphatidyltransferase family protein [Nanoarchaeota archaeon]MBU1973993.1 CDP-alcohol phosphatidyltransferase family protein [Nanoarchaeota archaeon]
MEIFWNRIIEQFREKRSKQLQPLAKFLLKIHLTANRITLFSLIMGFFSAYFLFDNYFLFLIFGLLHLIGDGLDGIVARLGKPTKYGNYFDFLSDRIIVIIFLVKIGLYLDDYYVFVALALLIITQSINLLSRLKYQSAYSRTVVFIALILNLPLAAYLAAGAISLYSLTLQFKYWLEKRL